MSADQHDPTGRIDSISRSSIIAVKKPINFTARVLHAVRKFMFVADKQLEENYSPKYRWLLILSGVIVPVRPPRIFVWTDTVSILTVNLVFNSARGTRLDGPYRLLHSM
jgi:hypothetical protein